MKTYSKNNMITMVLTALFCALVAAMAFIPNIGYIRYSPISLEITTIHVVVILGAVVLGPLRGCIISTFWGCTSLAYAFMLPSAVSQPFMNPLISVLPRVFVGLVAGWCFIGVTKLCGKVIKKRNGSVVISAVAAAIAGSLTNTILVLTALGVFGNVIAVPQILQLIIETIFKVHGAIEIAVAVVLVPILAVPLFSLIRRMGVELKSKGVCK